MKWHKTNLKAVSYTHLDVYKRQGGRKSKEYQLYKDYKLSLIHIYLGAKDDNKASYYATQGIVMSLAHSLLFLIIGLFFIRPFLNMFTTNQNVINYGMPVSYTHLQFLW